MQIHKPQPSELSDYYKTYFKYVTEDDLLSVLTGQKFEIEEFFNSIPPGRELFQYAEGKWMLKEIAGHLCDTERILTYRALRIARNDSLPLQGFDENQYAANANYRERSLKNILKEFLAVREASITLFQNMSEEMFDKKGIANNSEVSVRALLFFVVGHARHHMGVIKERYLD